MDKHIIYIVGMMGAGKSFYGKRLSMEKNWQFVELDSLIESAAGMSIAEIFATEGEEKFRLRERLALESTFSMTDTVVSTGGGTAAWSDNMDLMNQQGHTIWIECDIDTMAERIINDGIDKRPMIQRVDDIKKRLTELLSARKAYYSQSQERVKN